MCGIVGFIGQEQAAPILLDGLAHLEYRGYDSAGVAVISAQGKLQVEKAVGRLKVLSEQIHGGADLEGCIGLGHTRWATHGAPNIINSHPHVSENGKFAVIHNGIIENYVEIKEFLIGQGIRFKSETDTEVVAQLLEFYYNECHDFLEAVGRVLRRIEGAYALGMLCADCPDRIIAARKDAPLLLGYGKGCNVLASDVTAIIKHTRDVAYMEDGEVAVLTREGIEVYDALEQKVEKKHFTIDWEVSAAEKGGYQHFMLKEIMEQPEALRRAISPRIKDGRVIFDDLKLPVEKMREFTRIFIVACGSSYHVGMIGKYNLEHLLRRNVEVVLASEFRYSDPIVDDKSLVIVISQSGETLDTMAALREAKKRGGYILSIVNVVGSSIARESDDVLYTWAGPEIAVATTKAYSTQLAVLDMIGLAFGEALGTVKKEEYNEAVAELQKLPEKMEQFLDANPGLRSRIPYRVRFCDYTADELLEISGKIAADSGFTITADAGEKLLGIFEKERQVRDFGNGRFCRSLVESAIRRKSVRLGVMDADDLSAYLDPARYSDEELFSLDGNCFTYSAAGEDRAARRIGFLG